jgi:hypothetical protein
MAETGFIKGRLLPGSLTDERLLLLVFFTGTSMERNAYENIGNGKRKSFFCGKPVCQNEKKISGEYWYGQ